MIVFVIRQNQSNQLFVPFHVNITFSDCGFVWVLLPFSRNTFQTCFTFKKSLLQLILFTTIQTANTRLKFIDKKFALRNLPWWTKVNFMGTNFRWWSKELTGDNKSGFKVVAFFSACSLFFYRDGETKGVGNEVALEKIHIQKNFHFQASA